jgi:23S rRNA (adenine1618-N6)-methyltransferase
MPDNQKPIAKAEPTKTQLHPRNKHKGRYDFNKLMEDTPELKKYIGTNKYGLETIDFFNSTAVKLLNQALLKMDYGIAHWDIPDGYLCPPIPGRADYIHHIADLLNKHPSPSEHPQGTVVALDVGTGSNCIYPILGHCEYKWKFVGSDIDPISVKSARAIAKSNNIRAEIRLQEDVKEIFGGIINDTDYFDFTMCNPPFHSSAAEATSANKRKIRNLSKGKARNHKGEKSDEVNVSFGGQHNELWCTGGELRFIKNMIAESTQYPDQVTWFTTLVSKQGNLGQIENDLKFTKAKKVKVIPMGQGNKNSRIVAWTFQEI